MYDHIKRGWFAISFMIMGFTAVEFALAFFMLGEQPLGIWLLKRKNQTPEEKTPAEQTPKEGPASAPSDPAHATKPRNNANANGSTS